VISKTATCLIAEELAYLLNRTLSLEQDSAAQELAKDAPNRPDVDGSRVMSRAHEDFRRTVVLRDHLLRHVLRRVGLFDARQSKVADLQHAVAVHQQIPWLDVAMEDARRVKILQTAQDLIQKHFDVVSRQVLGRHDDLVQIRLEQFCYHISGGCEKKKKIKS
jgi:virulence-associated protein VapD